MTEPVKKPRGVQLNIYLDQLTLRAIDAHRKARGPQPKSELAGDVALISRSEAIRELIAKAVEVRK